MKRYERTCVTVDLDAILENMRNMKKKLGKDVRMLAVIKTDGYGHGAVPIAGLLEPEEYLFGFATATAEEALLLRRAGIKKPVLILGYVFPEAYEKLIGEDVRLTVFREDALEELSECAARLRKKAKVHIKVDTGMNRIGISPDEEGLSFVGRALSKPNIETEGIFTHFSRADEADKSDALEQYERFLRFTERIGEEAGCPIPFRHCANSAGILELPETGMDMVRAGITMYGLWPSDDVSRDAAALKPALSWNSHIVYVKQIGPGAAVSYGGTFVAEKKMRVATIPVGYGDGYPRSLSNKGCVLLRGKRAPILGRVCMDQMMVDVTEIPEAAQGDEVTLLGQNGEEQISAEELGRLSGRFNYELVCGIGKRVPRVYLKEGKICGSKDYDEDYDYQRIK